MSIKFWLDDITILWDSKYIKEIWPTNEMGTEKKMNSITRMILLMTLISYISTLSTRFLSLGLISLCVIIIIYKYNTSNLSGDINNSTEGYSNLYKNPSPLHDIENIQNSDNFKDISHLYKKTKTINPFSNVLLGEKSNNEDKPAPPAFNKTVNNSIISATKDMIQDLNPGINDINEKLHGNLVDNLKFEQSLRQFYSTPNTNITSDQETFMDFLYGDMPSCKNSKFKTENNDLCSGNDRYNLY
jgi:hypothetical protein